jgi:hypothetical protein
MRTAAVSGLGCAFIAWKRAIDLVSRFSEGFGFETVIGSPPIA